MLELLRRAGVIASRDTSNSRIIQPVDPHWKRILIVFAHRDVRLLWTIAPGV